MRVMLGWRNLALIFFASALVFCILAEIILRAAGAGDFPLYNQDPDLGYVLRPGSGQFLNRYGWEFNDLGMGTRTEFAPSPNDVILVGDSIVLGSLFFDQAQRLGPQLSTVLGRQVWPIGAASWALLNEIRYLSSLREVATVSDIVFVTNSEDFTALSRWQNEYMHPTYHPMSILLYAINNGIWRLINQAVPAPMPHASNAWEPVLDHFLRFYRGRVTFVLHPMSTELPMGPHVERLRLRAPRVQFCEPAPMLSLEDYRDYIHISPVGMRKLALAIDRCFSP